MKTLSITLGLLAMINLILIISASMGEINSNYIPFGFIYAISHIGYQYTMKEGLFSKSNKKRQ